MNIALIGRTGSGKSCLAKKLAAQYNLDIIDSNMLRDYINAKMEGFEIVEKHMKYGELVPCDLVEKALVFKIEKSRDKNGFVFDNVQAHHEMLERHLEIDKAFYLKVDEETANRRVQNRRRNDLNEEFLNNRKASFENNIENVLSYLGNRVVEIDASVSEEDVWLQVQLYDQ